MKQSKSFYSAPPPHLFNIINKGAFTLIELLVVVLIIGILAAIALPQYTKAVDKSRTVALSSKINTLYNALERYEMQNSAFPVFGTIYPTQDQINEVLDIDIVLDKNVSIVYYTHAYIALRFNNSRFAVHISKGLANTTKGRQQRGLTTCRAAGTEDNTTAKVLRSKQLCQSLCGALTFEDSVFYCIM